MASLGFKGFVGIAVVGSMLASSTVATAAGSAPAPQISPWATLTVLSGGAPAAALCGAAAAAAAAQPGPGCVLPVMDAPPPVAVAEPPAPVPPPPAGFGTGPLLLGLVAIAVAAGLFFAVKDHNHHNQPNSPG